MATVISILPQPTIAEDIRQHIIVRLMDPPSSIGRELDEMRSGLIRISSIERLKREDKKLRKDLKFWVPSLSEINMAVSNEQDQTDIIHEEFRDVVECVQFIRSCGNKNVVLVLSQHHAQNKILVSTFKKLPQIVCLYCYQTETRFKNSQKKWFIEGQSFARDILPRNVMKIQAKYLDKASQLLLTHIFLAELLVNLPRAPEAKKDFIMFCHSTYRNDSAYSTYKEKIERFNRTYNEQDVIEWYTDPESFIFRIVSKACANFDIVALFQTRLILRDLYIKLHRLHKQQLGDLLKQDIMVYRGKMMSKNELDSIKINSGLFITRHFLSTSTNKDVAIMHSGDGALVENEVSVLISMKIDRTEVQDKPIAFIGNHSQLGSESEVMLSMGIVFHLQSIEEVYGTSKHSVVINMIRGEDEKQIEKNLSWFHLVAQTGASCAALGMIPFLISTNNSQHVAECSELMSHVLHSSNPEVAEQLSAISTQNIQPVSINSTSHHWWLVASVTIIIVMAVTAIITIPLVILLPSKWSNSTNMNSPRVIHTASVLTNGKVLVIGGSNGLNTAELYDTSTGVWTITGNMNHARRYHTASILTNGKVLVTGGSNGTASLNSAELYDPLTAMWIITGNMNYARWGHTAFILTNGKVLVTGGSNDTASLNSAELYDSSTGVWAITGNMNHARRYHTASILTNGKVLVTGGSNGTASLNSAELYDPSAGVWTINGNMNYARWGHKASILTNGKVLVTGGSNDTASLNSAELYDSSTGVWAITGNMNHARRYHTASILTNGKVLVTGGSNGTASLNSAELYDPLTGMWTITDNMNHARWGHTTSILTNGRVLVTGGISISNVHLNSSELYQP